MCRNRGSHACIYAWRPEDNHIGCSSAAISLVFFESGYLTGLEISRRARPGGQQALESHTDCGSPLRYKIFLKDNWLSRAKILVMIGCLYIHKNLQN